MFSQRMVENFFKRTKFRRSRRLRSSFRTSLIKKGPTGSSPSSTAASNVSSPVAAKRPASRADRRSDGGASCSTSGQPLVMASDSDAGDKRSVILESVRRLPSFVGKQSSRTPPEVASRGNKQQQDTSTVSGLTAMSAASEGNNSDASHSSCSPKQHKLQQQRGSNTHLASNGVISINNNNHFNHIGRPISSAGSLPVLPRPELNGNGTHEAVDQVTVDCLRLEVESLRKELTKKQDAISKMQDREKQLRERLSEQAQRQLERGASKFEDISLGENRPTQLVKRYGNLYSEARLDAMDALDELPDMADADDLKVKLLLSIVVLAFRSAQRTLLETKTKVRELLHIPSVLHGGSSSLSHLVQEVEDTIAVFLRKTVEKHDVAKNYEEVCDRVWETLYDYPSLRSCAGLLRYVDECVRLAWALTLQNPPLVVDYESKRFDPAMHVRFHTSDPDSADIKCVLWPVLTEGDGGVCVYRGVVVT